MKKKALNITLIAAVFVAILSFHSCKPNDDDGIDIVVFDNIVAQIELSATTEQYTLGTGNNQLQFTAVAKNRNGQIITDAIFIWESTDTSLATVDPNGLVTALNPGTVTISAESGSIAGEKDLVIRENETPLDGNLALINVHVIDMINASVLMNQTVLVKDGFITKLGNTDEVTIPDDFDTIDGEGRFLSPGLADMHVHPFRQTDLIPYIANGVTTILDMGNGYNFTNAKNWKDLVRSDSIVGPNIYVAANVRAASDNGHPSTIANTPAQGIQFVQNNNDYDFIKVYNGLSQGTFNAVIDEASNQNLTVIGHIVRQPGLSGVLAAGQKMIAHAEEYNFTIFSNNQSQAQIDQAINLTLNAGAYVTGNLSLTEAFAILWGNPPGLNELMNRDGVAYLNDLYLNGSTINGGPFPSWSQIANNFTSQTSGSWQNVLTFQKNFLKQFHDAGIPLLLGTDSPVQPGMVPGFSLHEDMRLYNEAGFSNYEVLKIGTVNAGEFIKNHTTNSELFGVILECYRADLILSNDNPLDNLATLKSPAGVMVRGRWYSRQELDELLDSLN